MIALITNNTAGYKVMLFLHILTAVVAFAPAFVHPLLARQTNALDAADRGKVFGMLAGNGRPRSTKTSVGTCASASIASHWR